MNILVVGGAGYIGSRLIPDLIERGYKVDVLDLLWFGNHLPSEIEIIKKDIFSLTENDLKPYDQVLFLAGLSNDPMAEFSPALNFIANSSAPAYLAYISKKAKVKRYIYAGSCSVYGYTVDELYDENSPTISDYPYGISKLQGEQSVVQMQDDSFSVIAFRQGTVSGYSPRMRLDLIVNAMFKTALVENKVIINNPAIWRPILSIEDAKSAYIRAIESSMKISGIFNIASGNYTVGEVGDLVKERLNKKLNLDVGLEIHHKVDFRNYKVSSEKAMDILSFKPKNTVESIIDELINNKNQFNDFDNQNYYNIEIFKNLESKFKF